MRAIAWSCPIKSQELDPGFRRDDEQEVHREIVASELPRAMPPNKLLLEAPITLRWRDLDALNHVNNASFLTYFEEARLRWFARLAGPWSAQGYSPVLAAVQINYRRQLGWPADVVVELACERVGNTSLTLAHRLADAADRSLVYADGTSVLVWVDPATAKPVALPEAVVMACR